ncbi:MAG: hypothetical protein WC354_07480, partial [Candidatus Omnitrophota bacterium]
MKKLNLLFLFFLFFPCNAFADYQIKSDDVRVDVSSFSGILSSSDNDVQKALDTIDDFLESDPAFAAWQTSYDHHANWDTAYGWGDHAGLYDATGTASGLLSTHNSTYDHSLIATALQSESDPAFAAWQTSYDHHANWDTAYGWGDHASAGYVPYSGAAANVDLGSYTFTAGPDVYVKNAATSGNPALHINQQGAASRSKYLNFEYQGTVRARIMSDGQTTGDMTFKVHNGTTLVTALVFNTSGNADFQSHTITTTGVISGSNVSGTNTGDETQSTIKTKLGAAATGADGYLTSTDWNTFNGKQAGHANLASLSALSFVSTSFVKMTAAGTFGLDTNTYMTTDEKVKNVSGDASAGYLAEKLAALYPSLYQRDQKWALKTPYTTAANRYTILTPNKLSVDINGTVYFLTAQAEVDLSSAANWDATSPTNYTTAANRAGKDFYIYACVPVSGSSPKIVLSANSTTPSGYSASTSRKIGGFHGLCVAVGTISGHTLTGFVAGDVLPASIWDLVHRPVSNPEGMVYCEGINKWVDIYLASGTGSSTASVYGASITDTRDWNDFVDDGGAVKKKMLTDPEFQIIAAGSNEETNITGSADPGTTGGHVDTASQRMISNIGVEDACGVVWQWLSDQSATYDSSATEGWTGADSGKGYLYYLDYTRDLKLIAGGGWYDGGHAGSRSRAADSSRWY